jgi:hypothetical protein
MGCRMKNGIATHSLPHECFVLQIDGRIKSTHRRCMDAVRAGLRLKDQFPHHDIKVRATQTSAQLQPMMRGTALH